MTDFLTTHTVSGQNLSFVWAEVVRGLLAKGQRNFSPLNVTIADVGGDTILEDTALREKADEILTSVGGESVETAAWTIFPEKHWRMMGGDRHEFFDELPDFYERVQELNKAKNGRGTYFQRLTEKRSDDLGKSQLAYLLDTHDERPDARQSMWQASVFDPARDHTRSAQLQFPCLQHINLSFTDEGAVVLNAFYATQQIVHRGYGNYLGLMQLGRFLASQMIRTNGAAREFAGVSVYIATAKQDKIPKSHPVLASLPALLEERFASSNHGVVSSFAES